MRRLWRFSSLSSVSLGCIFLVVTLVAGIVLFQKQRVTTNITPGEKIAVELSGNYRIDAFKSKVKIAGIQVGTVTSVKRVDDEHTRMELKVKKSSLESMGTAPSAKIRPATLLGGNYYVEIVPGGRRGEFSGTIPQDRTALPVELDSIAAALDEPAREGIRSSIADLGDTFDDDGQRAVEQLATNAPDVLKPAAGTFEGLRGTQPGTDLRDLVSGFEATSRILSEKQGQLDSTLQNLAATTGVLDARRHEITASVARLPEALRATDTMLGDLTTTLTTLQTTADDIRPSVRELDTLLDDLDPTLVKARPVIGDLRVVAREARPLVDDLTPISRDLTGSLDDVNGTVLDRVNGPILTALNSGWQGEGLYGGTGSDHPLYQEIGYTVSNLTQANMADGNGGMVSFLPGAGPASAAGLPFSLEQIFQVLMNQSGAGR